MRLVPLAMGEGMAGERACLSWVKSGVNIRTFDAGVIVDVRTVGNGGVLI
jgi:hypothetical protein